MAVTVHRVCRRIYASLDGEGARGVGGRWNSPGRPFVYMAQSVALAVLENLVHMSRPDYPTGYVGSACFYQPTAVPLPRALRARQTPDRCAVDRDR